MLYKKSLVILLNTGVGFKRALCLSGE